MTQTSFEVPPPPHEGRCAWCDEPTRLRLTLEPARFGTDRRTGLKELRKPERWVWVCSAHDRSLDRTGSGLRGRPAPTKETAA